MATNFKLKRSSVASKRPGLTNLELGELALNTYDGFLFTERNGLGITTVTNLTPWYENYGAGSIFYTNKVGIGTTAVPDTNQLLVKGGTETDRLNVTGVSTFTGAIDANGDLDVDGHTELDNLRVSGIATVQNNLHIPDDSKILMGDNNDFRIYHNPDNSLNYIVAQNNGPLLLRSSNANMIHCSPQGAVTLYHDGNTKAATTVGGFNVTGTTDTDNFINTGISTFVGIITASATQNVIPFLFNAWSDIPSASSYHGAFIHVHERAKAYYAHAANWYELVNKELDGTIGVGTELVNVGITTVTDLNATGNVTLGNADTDNIVFTGEINSNVIPNTNIAYDLGSSTKRWGTLFTGATTKIDSDIITRNLSVTGLGTFANDVTFTGASYNAVWDQSDNALEFAENAKASFGNNGEIEIFRSGTESIIVETQGNNLSLAGNRVNLLNQNRTEALINAIANGPVELYHNNTKRLETTNKGVTITSQLDVTNINTSGIITAVDGNFTGNVSIGGTLTYQDVTNVDSIGIATARVGLDVLSGGINAVGIVTADGLDAIGIQSGGVNITTGIITAINFTGIGNTVTYDSSTKIVSVSVGGAGGGTGGKFVENATGIHTLSNVGIGTTTASDKLKVLGDVAFTGALKVSPLGLSGSNGQFLKSVGTGVTWSSFPTARTVGLQTATANQTSFSFAYNVGFLDVYINGVKLTTNEFTATNGTSVVLTEGAFLGDQVQFISFNTTATGGGGGGSGITDVVQDATPQLGGNLDLNSKTINGSGNIDYTGNLNVTGIATFSDVTESNSPTTGSVKLSGGLGVVKNIQTSGGLFATGTAGLNVTHSADINGDLDVDGHTELDNTNIVGLVTVTNVSSGIALKLIDSAGKQFFAGGGGGGSPFAGSQTGHDFRIQVGGAQNAIFKYASGATGNLELGPSSGIGITFNGSTGNAVYAGIITATKFVGDGSSLTGISGSGGVTVQDEGSALSTTGTTLNFVGSGVVASGNGAVKTITIAGGGSGNAAGFSTAGGNFTVNAGVTTVIDTFNINTNTKLSEYTVHLENVNGNIQSQKVLVMNYGAGIGLTAYSSEYGIMFHPNQIADIGVVVTSGICSLTATTKSGITGITTFSLTRQDQS